jgi:hypothetical protein
VRYCAHPPVLVPPIKSKISQGSTWLSPEFFRASFSRFMILRRMNKVDRPRTPPPSNDRRQYPEFSRVRSSVSVGALRRCSEDVWYCDDDSRSMFDNRRNIKSIVTKFRYSHHLSKLRVSCFIREYNSQPSAGVHLWRMVALVVANWQIGNTARGDTTRIQTGEVQ